MIAVDQCQGDNFQIEGIGHRQRHGFDQFTKTAGGNQAQVECLMALHDLLVDVGLIQQLMQL